MSDGQFLLLIFTLIYVSDSGAWFGERGFLFLSFWGRSLSIRRHNFYFPGFRAGFAFLNPLPFLGQGYISSLFPFSLSEQGLSPVCAENPNPGPAPHPESGAVFLSWDAIESVKTDEKRLLVDGVIYRRFKSVHEARFWARQLNRILSADDRGEEIRSLVRRYFHSRRAGKRLALFRRATWNLRFGTNLLFFLVFLLLPAIYWRFGDSVELLRTCGLIWLFMIHLALQTYLLHRRFFPGEKGDRLQHLLVSLLLPNHAIRHVDSLSRHFFVDCHPLALGIAGVKESALLPFQRSVARDLAHPVPFEGESREVETAARFREDYLLPEIERLLPGWRDLVPPVEPIEEIAYCPRCLTPYCSTGAICEDCGGIEVIPSN